MNSTSCWTLIADQPALTAAIDALLEKKRQAPEMGLSPQIPAIHAFIERELERLESIKPVRHERQEVVSGLSRLFRTTLDEAWKP